MEYERVVITGIGAISGIGNTAAECWQNALDGVSGVAPITLFDASNFLVQIASEVKNFHPEEILPVREIRRRDRFELLASAAAGEAVKASGLEITDANRGRIGAIISTGIGGLESLSDGVLVVEKGGPRKVSPFVIPMLMANGAAGMIAIDYGIHGPTFSVASACASGADGIGMAWMMIRNGMMDAALAGASEAAITPVAIAAFDRLGATSRRNDDYSMTPQPFDRNRDGLVMGEGAAVLVLESESHARKRGAVILAELAGYGATSDAFHITAPAEDGAGGTKAMLVALESAHADLAEVGYISAHGTATQLNDLSETLAIKAAFGEQAYRIPISSTKSMTGHMMGATAALEAVFCTMVVREGMIPPTIHYETPDPACDLDYVPNQARQVQVKLAISNAFGFGGHNSVLVIRKWEG